MRVRVRFAPRDLVCRQAVELVPDYLEYCLPAGARRRFEAHLAGCPHCTEYLAQLRATIELTGRVGPADLSPPMRADFIARYRRWQADHGSSLD